LAYSNSIENCRLNNAVKIQVAPGGAGQIKNSGMFDSIFANINRNILLRDIHSYVPALKKDGLLFMSGFYKEDMPVIEEECNKNGLYLLSYAEQDNWVAVKTQNQIKPEIS
jgi:ribosomal protein L11 methyltransferase